MGKKIVVPDPNAPGPQNEILLSPSEHLELMRLEFDAKLAASQTQLATATGRAVRLEIQAAARAADEGITCAQDALQTALVRQKAFAQTLAQRYHFSWTTHSFDPDLGIVRRVAED